MLSEAKKGQIAIHIIKSQLRDKKVECITPEIRNKIERIAKNLDDGEVVIPLEEINNFFAILLEEEKARRERMRRGLRAAFGGY